MKKCGKIISLIVSAAVTLTAFSGCGKKEYAGIDVTFLKVGKADAIIIRTAEHTVLIDSANQGEGKDIYRFCKNYGRETADYFILTHFDKDHVGGAKAVLNKFENIENIIQPGYEETSEEYLNYISMAEEKGYSPVVPEETMTFTLDEAVFTVYPAMEKSYSQVNDYSIAVTVEYGENAFLFAGDAENKRLGELIQQLPERKNGYSLVKMPHHGGKEKKTDDFIEYTDPKLAVITCSKKEPAEEKTVKLLEDNDTEIFYTYNGDINFHSDGYEVTSEIIQKQSESIE